VLSGLAWIRAAQRRLRPLVRAAGLLLAGAVLSKYFAAILGFAYLVDALRRRRAGALAGVAIAYACTLPALALMAWWNSANCWPNYMFNFVNRHGDAGWSLKTPLLYAVTLIYVLGPPVLWLALKNRRSASADFLACLASRAGHPGLAALPAVRAALGREADRPALAAVLRPLHPDLADAAPAAGDAAEARPVLCRLRHPAHRRHPGGLARAAGNLAEGALSTTASC
jgi:hypothetical protein